MPGEVDPETPFFLSYARAGAGLRVGKAAQDSDHLVERFFSDLSENVAQLISLKVGVEAGFMDRSMRGGMRWTDELLHALGTCQILVALLSARYLRSEWCGMEWHALSQRKIDRKMDGASDRQGCIIPVAWAPVDIATLPSPISAELLFSPTRRPNPDIVNQYWEEGIFGLMRTRQETSYQIIVWQLAKHISNIYHSQHVETREFKIEQLRNIFWE